MSDIAQSLGQRIRELRTNQHMSQEELSFKAGISAAHLGQIERAIKNPTVDTVAKIASALNISLSALFSFESSSDSQSDITTGKINAYLSNMTDREKKDVLRILRIFYSYSHK